MDEKIAALGELLMGANYAIAFTGAGISTESGIPDFRSPGAGLWEKIDPELLSARTLRTDPALFYRCWRELESLTAGKLPNKGHAALAELSRLGTLRAVVTQNIDGLHQQAGSKRVFEVHGNLEGCRCLACKSEHPAAALREQLAAGAEAPLSPCCKAVLRPSVVLFGDRMAADFAAAQQEAFRSDFALVVGTSLTVWPAAEIPLTVGRFAIVNRDETALDDRAELRIAGPIGETLAKVVEYVREKRSTP
ncbi:MAG: Sir2 family NAD-dependent protein deacetylase [Sporomusaceae bacterium]|nr:Sir2 family NAD-dependent protein deacetylase [Sporomusaceae bacterium]